MHYLPVIASIYVLTAQVLGDYGKTDYRFIENGLTKWCVYATIRDIRASFSDNHCIVKNLPAETHIINGHEVQFWARLSSVEGGRNRYRYIKNCTAPPSIEGAEVDCTDESGAVVVRVHDTCRVKCTSAGHIASQETSTCQRSGEWEEVTCIPHSCPPLKSMRLDRNTSCDIDAWLPLNTTCPITCPLGYEPKTRVLKCEQGQWTTMLPCAYMNPALKVELPEPASDWQIPTIIVLVLFGVIILLGIVLKCRKTKTASDDTSKNEKVEGTVNVSCPSLSSSSSSGVPSAGSESEGSEPLLSDVVVDGGPDEISATTMSVVNEQPPPGYESAIQEIHLGNGCCQVELKYCCNDDQWMPLLPYDTLYVAEETEVIIQAYCLGGHNIYMLKCGPPFRQYEDLGNKMKVTIKEGDAGSFLLWTKCSQQNDLVVVLVNIQLTDVPGNVEHTNVKQPVGAEDHLGSLAHTVEEAPVDAVSGPSEPLKAEIFSLPSNPCLLTSSLNDAEDEAVGGGARAGDGARPKTSLRPARSTTSLASRNSCQNDEESQSCGLLIGELRKRRHLREKWRDLVLYLQPIDSRPISMTIGGAAMDILGFSIEKVDYLTWAKRTDLRESPAEVILTCMIQEGKTACHLVRYFSDSNHHRQDVIRLLQAAHEDCHVCCRYK
ncbi:uncharacterized protein [Haliotis asinina]|uniref:uncharacterized protein n=1 Tax=Haliotis asinina TaxID=109174 RepID=UPI00353240AD